MNREEDWDGLAVFNCWGFGAHPDYYDNDQRFQKLQNKPYQCAHCRKGLGFKEGYVVLLLSGFDRLAAVDTREARAKAFARSAQEVLLGAGCVKKMGVPKKFRLKN